MNHFVFRVDRMAQQLILAIARLFDWFDSCYVSLQMDIAQSRILFPVFCLAFGALAASVTFTYTPGGPFQKIVHVLVCYLTTLLTVFFTQALLRSNNPSLKMSVANIKQMETKKIDRMVSAWLATPIGYALLLSSHGAWATALASFVMGILLPVFTYAVFNWLAATGQLEGKNNP